jgi:hypothetical protein
MRSGLRSPFRLIAGSLLGTAVLAAAGAMAQLPERRTLPVSPPSKRAPKAPPVAVPAAEPKGSLLDEVGRLAHATPTGQISAWKTELKTTGPAASRAASLHLWLGEYTLAHDEQPDLSIWHFRRARKLTSPTDRRHGLAAYNTAIALYYSGRYPEAAHAFQRLLQPKSALTGFSRRRCALWSRMALACAGYHAEHAKMAIPQPERLDPLCGAAGLAICLRALSLPYDKETVTKACRYTGMGSSAHDIVDACRKLGVVGRVVTADEQGLKALPKPAVAFVERDHFIAVTRADEKGVSYYCSDCGHWPGG